MTQYGSPQGAWGQQAGYTDTAQYGATATAVQQSFITKVFGWMTLGLLLSGSVAYLLGSSGFYPQGGMFWLVALGTIGLSIGLSAGINKMSAGTATTLFVIYSILMGVFLSVIFVVYQLGTIYAAFFSTAGMFGVMALIGATTKRDLTRFGSFLMMALIGVFIATFVGMFWANSVITFIWLYVGLLVFLGLTVYEVWVIKKSAGYAQSLSAGGQRKMAIVAALSLYLSFINIFVRMLAILGGGGGGRN